MRRLQTSKLNYATPRIWVNDVVSPAFICASVATDNYEVDEEIEF